METHCRYRKRGSSLLTMPLENIGKHRTVGKHRKHLLSMYSQKFNYPRDLPCLIYRDMADFFLLQCIFLVHAGHIRAYLYEMQSGQFRNT